MILLIYPSKTLAVTQDQFSVRGLSNFNDEQAIKLESWLTQGVNATRATLGVYPAPLNLYLYPKKSNQPIPWAFTRRDGKGSVHFYVDTRFSLEKFINDWTIYHELAHMALPYLGDEYMWFSEGFASFMQYQIMHQSGVLKVNLEKSYQTKITPHLRWFNSDLAPASIAKRLMNKEQYPAAYWGSAYFFILADKQLRQKHNVSLVTLISYYQDCCRDGDNNLSDVIASLDGIIEDQLFNQLMNDFENLPARKLYPEVFAQ